MVQILSKLLSRRLSFCDSIAAIFSSLVPCTVDLAGVIFPQEAAVKFVFLSGCSDLFNLLLCSFSVPTLSSFQNQSSFLLYTRYTYKGLCPFFKLSSRICIYNILVNSNRFLPLVILILCPLCCAWEALKISPYIYLFSANMCFYIVSA